MKIRLGKHHSLDLIKFISFIINVVFILLLIWLVVSYIDVLCYQMKGGTNHQWNFFVWAMNFGEVFR